MFFEDSLFRSLTYGHGKSRSAETGTWPIISDRVRLNGKDEEGPESSISLRTI